MVLVVLDISSLGVVEDICPRVVGLAICVVVCLLSGANVVFVVLDISLIGVMEDTCPRVVGLDVDVDVDVELDHG